MKKFAKITGIVLACLLGVLIVVPIAFQGKIKEIVISEGNKLLNAEFGFDDLSISLFREFPKASVGLEGFWLKGVGAPSLSTTAGSMFLCISLRIWSVTSWANSFPPGLSGATPAARLPTASKEVLKWKHLHM